MSFSSPLAYTIAAIPTIYSGVRYRSRLEARWAAMFDMLGWKHHYEPMDLNGWIPDFLIDGHDKVLVEVKPIVEIDWGVVREIDAACTNMEAMILGCVVPVSYNGHEFGIGWLREDGVSWALASPIRADGIDIGFCHSEQSFRDRITGRYDGCSALCAADEREIVAKWKEAGNIVQWHKH